MSTPTILTGRWHDYNQGRYVGEVITLSGKDSELLIAFIAIFDAFVGVTIWNIMAICIWRIRLKTDAAHDGFYYQSQALLRNTAEPWTFTRDMIMSGWTWRKISPRSLLRTVMLCFLAMSVSILSSAAGILSSQIATSNSHVLLTGATCGIYNSTLGFQYVKQAQLALTYAETCYTNPVNNLSGLASTGLDAASNPNCNFYVQPALNFTASTGNQCPFTDSSVCNVPESEILKLDTGYLNSNVDLGINQPEDHSVLFRRIMTCSPLTSQGFINEGIVEIPSVNNQPGWTYDYGPYVSETPPDGPLNITFSYLQSYYNASDVPYYVQTVTTTDPNIYTPDEYPNISVHAFTPSPRLSTGDLPFTLVFLANRQLYFGEAVNDTWFNATDIASTFSNGESIYFSNVVGRTLGCTEQVEFCNPINSQCTDPNLWWNIYNNASAFTSPSSLDMNEFQRTIASTISNTISKSSIQSMFGYLASNLLNAQQQPNALSNTNQESLAQPLPSNQWQVEAASWLAASNAMLQRLTVDSVTGGPLAAQLKPNLLPYNFSDSTENDLCNSQRVKSPLYQNFSVLGLILNFTIGGIIVITGLTLQILVPKLELRRAPSKRPWLSMGLLQLQGMAYTQRGAGYWRGDSSLVPYTKERQLFQMPMIGIQEQTPTGFTDVSNAEDSFTEGQSLLLKPWHDAAPAFVR